MGFDLTKLNEEQLRPVLDTEGALLVTAGAGSGKTRLLTHRIAYLILEKNVPAYNVLAITFTNKAAAEMRDRIYRMVPDAKGLFVSTFHSMCATILRRFVHKLGYTTNFSIYGENEKERLIKRFFKENDYDDDYLKEALSWISRAKNEGMGPEEYYSLNKYLGTADVMNKAFVFYENELKKCNALDFDDLLLKTFQLLKTDAEARDYYTDRFRYIHVDEFQDTNTIQYSLVKILASKHGNVLVVGDEDQSIYGWRGANISNIFDFKKDFSCKVYKLEQNYRSTKKILDIANKLIKNNGSRLDKTLWTDNPGGEDINAFAAETESREAEYVVSTIHTLMRSGEYKFSDFAVLIRLNSLTRSFEEKFLQYGIPCKIFGGFKFYERKEIKDILSYFRLVVNESDEDAIERVINFPKRGIGGATVQQLKNYSQVTGIKLMDVITGISDNPDLPLSVIKKVRPFSEVVKCLLNVKDELTLSQFTSYLIRLLNLKEVFKDDTEENENRKQNITELVGSIKQYEEQNPESGLEEYLQNVSLYSDLDEMDEDSGSVSIVTVHSAKGLEFRVVFIAGLEDGIFPISRSMDSLSELEEERRLMYVAITRARERLYMTFSLSRFLYGERKPTIKSRFFEEIGCEMPDSYLSRQTYGGQSAYASRDRSSYGGGYGSSANRYSSDTVRSETTSQSPSARTGSYNQPVKKELKDIDGFRPGVRVRHKKFGDGVIKSVSNEQENTYAEIEFAAGTLLLALHFAPLEIIKE